MWQEKSLTSYKVTFSFSDNRLFHLWGKVGVYSIDKKLSFYCHDHVYKLLMVGFLSHFMYERADLAEVSLQSKHGKNSTDQVQT